MDSLRSPSLTTLIKQGNLLKIEFISCLVFHGKHYNHSFNACLLIGVSLK